MGTIILALKTGIIEGGQDTLILAALSALTVWPLWRGIFFNHKISNMKYSKWIPVISSMALFLLGVGMLGDSALASKHLNIESQPVQSAQTTQTIDAE